MRPSPLGLLYCIPTGTILHIEDLIGENPRLRSQRIRSIATPQCGHQLRQVSMTDSQGESTVAAVDIIQRKSKLIIASCGPIDGREGQCHIARRSRDVRARQAA